MENCSQNIYFAFLTWASAAKNWSENVTIIPEHFALHDTYYPAAVSFLVQKSEDRAHTGDRVSRAVGWPPTLKWVGQSQHLKFKSWSWAALLGHTFVLDSPILCRDLGYPFAVENHGKWQVAPHRLAKFLPARGCFWLGRVGRRGAMCMCRHVHAQQHRAHTHRAAGSGFRTQMPCSAEGGWQNIRLTTTFPLKKKANLLMQWYCFIYWYRHIYWNSDTVYWYSDNRKKNQSNQALLCIYQF